MKIARRARDAGRHPRAPPPQDVLHDARGGELRLRPARGRGRAGGLGRGGLPGRSDLERGVGGVRRRDRRALRRALAPRLGGDGHRGGEPRDGPPRPGQSLRPRGGGDGALGPERAGARRARPPAPRRPRARPRAAVVVARRRRSRRRDRGGARQGGGRPPHLQGEDRRPAVGRGRGARAPAARGARARDRAARGRQPGLGSADGAPGHPRARALRPRLRRAARPALGSGGHGGDRAPCGRADHGGRVLLLPARRARAGAPRGRQHPRAQADQVRGHCRQPRHRPHRRGGGPDVLCRLHDRDLARHGGLPAGGARRRARRLGLRALRSAPAHRRRGAGARRATRTAPSSRSTVPATASRSTRRPSANGRRAPDAP